MENHLVIIALLLTLFAGLSSGIWRTSFNYFWIDQWDDDHGHKSPFDYLRRNYKGECR